MTKTLDRASILKAHDCKATRVNVPEWGGDVFIRAMSGTDRAAFEDAAAGLGDKPADQMRSIALFLTFAICDSTGKRYFAADDVDLLLAKSVAPLMRLFEAASAINAITAKDIEDLAKN